MLIYTLSITELVSSVKYFCVSSTAKNILYEIYYICDFSQEILCRHGSSNWVINEPTYEISPIRYRLYCIFISLNLLYSEKST